MLRYFITVRKSTNFFFTLLIFVLFSHLAVFVFLFIYLRFFRSWPESLLGSKSKMRSVRKTPKGVFFVFIIGDSIFGETRDHELFSASPVTAWNCSWPEKAQHWCIDTLFWEPEIENTNIILLRSNYDLDRREIPFHCKLKRNILSTYVFE